MSGPGRTGNETGRWQAAFPDYPPEGLNPSKQQEVEGLFAAHGYEGRLKIARVTSEDERIFVLARAALDSLSDVNVLLISLQEVLRRKVWIVDESPAWADVVPFD